jgi:hypothetical protein
MLWARPRFPVAPLGSPFRSVAGVDDIHALFFNPAALGYDESVEMAYWHRYARRGPGGDNAVAMRLKSLAASISWLEDAVYGNRREYIIGLGHVFSPSFSLGTTYRYIKANDSTLQNTHTWTHSFQYRHSALWSLGARWENPWHEEVSDEPTNGEFVTAFAVRPLGRRALFSVDWFYPEEAVLNDTRLVFAAYVQATPGLDLAAHFDTDNRFGIELRLLFGRAATGVEAHFTEPGGRDYGTLYASLLNRNYENSKQKRGAFGVSR